MKSFYSIGLCLVLFFGLHAQQQAYAHHPGALPAGGFEIENKETISSAGMLNSPTASTLGYRRFAGGFDFRYTNFNEIEPSEGHELHHDGREIHGFKHLERYTMVAGYGLREDLDLYLSAPIVSTSSNQIDEHRTAGRNERATGFGDMSLTGKYRFYQKEVEAALIAGVKFPTGETSARDKSGAKMGAELQPGSGSWDGTFGIAVSRSFKNRFSASTSFEYFLRTKGGQQFDGGDIFRASAAVAASLRPYGTYPNANVHLEVNQEWARRDHERGVKTFDSGGTATFLTPGISFSLSRHVSAFWAMPVPVYQNVGGRHEKVEYQILSGISIAV